MDISHQTKVESICTLNLSRPWAKSWSSADGIDQYQTAQNVQFDLDLFRRLAKSGICSTIICGTLWILFTVAERDRFYQISCAERVKFYHVTKFGGKVI